MEPIVALLKPLVVPLLKLRVQPPHLPEGTSLVRHIKPAANWLTLRYLQVLLRQGFGLAGGVVAWTAGVTALAQAGKQQLAIFFAITLLGVGLLGVLVALVTTRMDFELRDYLVGDRSLRVRQGAVVQREVTLSFANIQNIEVTQGPLERLFGFKSLTVSTAGGGGGGEPGQGMGASHHVTLEGLTDAEGLKALMLGMLQQHRDSGLGDESQGAPSVTLVSPQLVQGLLDVATGLHKQAEVLAVTVDFGQTGKN